MNHKLLLIVSAGLFLLLGEAAAAIKTFTGTGNFSTAARWSGSSLPSAGDDLVIDGTCTVDNSSSTDNVQYGSLTIGNASTGALNWAAGGTNRLNIYNLDSYVSGSSLDMTNGGTLIIRNTISVSNITITPGTGTIERQQTGTIAAITTYNNLIINTSGTVAIGATHTINGNLTVAGGEFSIGAYSLHVTGTTTISSTMTITSTTGTRSFGNLIINGTYNNSANDNINEIRGNFQNNGTFSIGSGRVTFTGAGSHTISGTAPATAFGGGITVNKGTGTANVLDVQSVITMSTGGLTLTNGTFKLSSASTITPFTSDISWSPYLIPGTAQLWCNGGTILGANCNWSVDGILKVSAGTVNAGNTADNRIVPITGSKIEIGGGSLNVAGRISSGLSWTFIMSSGNLTLGTVGNSTAGRNPFSMDAGCTFSVSGGTITIQSGGGSAGENTGFYNVASNGTGFTGGTLQIGNASTPASDSIEIETSVALHNLTINSANVTAIVKANTLTVNNLTTITAGTLSTESAGMTVKGNWVNNAGYSGGTGIVSFSGTNAQSISGSSATAFRKLSISNASGVTLQQDITVSDSLSMANGALTLNSKTLTIANPNTTAIARTNGYIVSESTNNSGKVTWNIGSTTGAHRFPFGTAAGSYIPFTLNLTSGTIGNVTVSTYPTAANNTPYPSTPTSVTNMYNTGGSDNGANTVDRFWQIDKNGSGGIANLTFTATSAEVGTISNLQAQRWNSAIPGWEHPYSGQTSTATSATVYGIFNFSPWTMSGNNSPLPIELVSLSAVAQEETVNLNWITATETNNDYFTIEKTKDGVNYQEVARLEGAGNSSITRHYSATDAEPYKGTSYYRLKQTDYNGDYSYSNYVVVNVNARPVSFTVYPNPCSGNRISIKIEAERTQEIDFLVSDLAGKACFLHALHAAEKGMNVFTLELPEQLKPGAYLISARCEERLFTSRLIITE